MAVQYVAASLNLLRANCTTLPLVMSSPPILASQAFNQATLLLTNASLCEQKYFNRREEKHFDAIEKLLLAYNVGLSFVTGGPRVCCRKPGGGWGLTAQSYEKNGHDDSKRDSIIGGVFGGVGGFILGLIVLVVCAYSIYTSRQTSAVIAQRQPAEQPTYVALPATVNSQLDGNATLDAML
jgi:hypothetical protein